MRQRALDRARRGRRPRTARPRRARCAPPRPRPRIMSYVELHCHSAYSFLDGASQPEELAARAAELGYEALALTDHDGVYGSLEFAHAAKALGVRPITGAEVTLAGGAHVTLLVETPRGYANLCRLLTAAHAATRPEGRARPAAAGAAARDAARAQRGPRLPLRLRAPRPRASATRTPPRALAQAFGRDRFFVELQRPYERGDARRQRAPARARRDARRRAPSRPATSTRTTRGAHALQDVLVAIRHRTSLDGCERERRGNHESRPAPARRDGRALPATTATPSRAPPSSPSGSAFDLTAGARLPLPGLLRRRRTRPTSSSRRVCDRAFAERYAARNGHKRRARERLDEELALIARARPLRLLPAPLGGARARARGRASRCAARARRATRCRPAAAAAARSARSSAT